MRMVAGAILVFAASVLVLAARPGPGNPPAGGFTTYTLVAALVVGVLGLALVITGVMHERPPEGGGGPPGAT